MTTIPTEPKKRHKLTQEDCDTAKYLMEHRQTLKEIAEIIGVDPSTVGKIRLADYNLEKYLEQRKAMNLKTKENKKALKFAHVIDKVLEEQGVTKLCAEIDEREKKLQQMNRAAAGGITKGVEQVAGQLQMELPEAEEQKPDDQTKMMRFFAAQVDKIAKRMDELIAVLKGGEKG